MLNWKRALIILRKFTGYFIRLNNEFRSRNWCQKLQDTNDNKKKIFNSIMHSHFHLGNRKINIIFQIIL